VVSGIGNPLSPLLLAQLRPAKHLRNSPAMISIHEISPGPFFLVVMR